MSFPQQPGFPGFPPGAAPGFGPGLPTVAAPGFAPAPAAAGAGPMPGGFVRSAPPLPGVPPPGAPPPGYAAPAPGQSGFIAPPGYGAPPQHGGFTQAAAPAFGWQGVQAAVDRDPMLRVGDYVLRITSNEMGFDPNSREHSFKGHVEVVWAAPGSESPVGERAAIIHKLAGKNAQRNAGRALSYVIAAAGYADEASYYAFDPQRQFMDAVVGVANAYSQAFPRNICGRLVRVQVRRGNDVLHKDTKQPTGDYYREYSWSPMPEESQDQTPMPRAA